MPEPSAGRPDPASWRYNSRLGLLLFAIYSAFYALFIFLAAFWREVMKQPSIGGVSLSVMYGFGLIIGAFVLAMVYMLLCKNEPQTGPTLTETEIAAKSVEEEGQA